MAMINYRSIVSVVAELGDTLVKFCDEPWFCFHEVLMEVARGLRDTPKITAETMDKFLPPQLTDAIENVQDRFHEAEANNYDGDVDFQDLLSLMTILLWQQGAIVVWRQGTHEELYEPFMVFDRDDTGFINAENLHDIFICLRRQAYEDSTWNFLPDGFTQIADEYI